MVVTLSHEGYVKYQPLTDYEAQRRGGKGKSATKMKDEDFIEKLLVANTHDTILCFSKRGRLYWLKVYQLPQASRCAWSSDCKYSTVTRKRAYHRNPTNLCL